MNYDFPSAAIQSPCTKVCTIDARTQLCVGCLRTGDEIMRWRDMTETQRRHFMQVVLPERGSREPQ